MLTFGEEVAEEKAYADGFTGFGGVGRDAQDSVINGLDFLDSFVAFNAEESIARAHGVAILLEPGDEGALFHGPAEARNYYFDGHRVRSELIRFIHPKSLAWPG
jgi:hypothetical protein